MVKKVLSMMLTLVLCMAGWASADDTVNAEVSTQNIYYVSPTGSDSNMGTLASPFRTIQKASSVMATGDTCIIRGGTYRETITPVNNGTSTAPITYKAYPGETVTISGSDPVTGWTLDSGNLYKAPMNWSLGDENQVFVNGEMMRLSQYPNWNNDSDLFDVGWASMQSGTATSITDTNLNKPDNYWVGATVIVKGWWSTQSAKITSSKGSTIYFDKLPWSDQYTNPGAGVKYMIAGVKGQLDRQKEWYYDTPTSTLYLWAPGGVDPNTLTVDAKKRKYAFDLTGRSYIHIEDVGIIGASITTNQGSYNMIKRINVQYLSHTIGLQKAYSYDDTGIDLSGSFNTIRDSEIKYSSGNGVVIRGTNNNVINNLIHDTDYMGTYNASVALAGGKQHLISYNTLYNTGRSIIGGEKFTESIIEFNDISRTGKLSYDLGGIYFARVDGGNTEIRNNWIHDMDSQSCKGCELGVYVDSNTHGFLIHHNTVWNAETSYYIGGRTDNNFIYNNQSKPKIIVNTSDYKYNNAVTNNIVEGGVSFQNGASSGVSAVVADNVTTGFNQDAYGRAGHNFDNPPNPVFMHDLPEYRNISLNYGFEADLEDWSLTGNGNVTYHFAPMLNLGDQFATTRTADGSALFGSGQNGIEQVVSGLQPNTLYEFSGWAKVASGEEAWLGVKNYGRSDNYKVVPNTSNGWKHVMIQFTTGASNTSATIYMLKNSTGSGAVYGDDIGIRKVRPSELIDPNMIPQSQMTATATSEETVQENNAASQAIDGDPSTLWHTKWDRSDALPQSITLNLGGTFNINKITYLPRQSGTGGIITGYKMYVSTDGTNFRTVGSGTWANDSSLKTVTFPATSASFVRLEATASPTPWASAAEINVFKEGDKIVNPGFESGDKTGWIGFGSWSVVNHNQHTGAYGAQINPNASAEQSITGLSSNTTYLLKAWVKVNDPGSPVFLGVKKHGGAEANVQITDTPYKQYTVSFTTGANNTTATIYLWRNGTGTGSAYGDDFTIVPANEDLDQTPPADATFVADVTAPTYTDVALAINYPDDAVVKEYKVGADGEWTPYTDTIVLSDNNIVYAKGKDVAGNTSNITSYEVSNIDKNVPTLTIQLDQTSLWPANHKMVTVNATLNLSDALSGIKSAVLTSITSNEPESGQGDIQARLGTEDTSFQLRAERLGLGSGRIYTITYTITDKAGNKAVATAIVTVPHDQSGKSEQSPDKLEVS